MVVERRVEVFGDDKTAAIDPEGPRSPRTYRHETSSRLAAAGDDDLLSCSNVVQQAGQMRLGFMDAYGLSHGLSLLSPHSRVTALRA